MNVVKVDLTIVISEIVVCPQYVRTWYVIVFPIMSAQTLVLFMMTLFHFVYMFVSRCERHVVFRSVWFLFCPGKYSVVNLSLATAITSCVTCNCLCTTKRAV